MTSFALTKRGTAQTKVYTATEIAAKVGLVHVEPKQIRIYTETIEISAIEYADLMTTPTNSNNHNLLRNKLLELVTKGKAKLVSNQSLIARSGEKATVESIREYIYPTEYEPAETMEPKKDFTPEQIASFQVLPPTPTAFETRNLGHTLEVEPTLGDDGKTIDLRLSPESTKHVGKHITAEWKTKTAEVNVEMPIFYTLRMNTSVTVIDGQFLLVNSYSPDKDGQPDHSRKVLQLVRAEILKLEATE